MACLSPLPWILTVEFLADVKEVDPNLLKALTDRISDFPMYSFNGTRERFSLACLEKYVESIKIDSSYESSDSSTSFDLDFFIDETEHSQELLARLHTEIGMASELQKYGDVLLQLKRKLSKFVHQKRIYYPKLNFLEDSMEEHFITSNTQYDAAKEGVHDQDDRKNPSSTMSDELEMRDELKQENSLESVNNSVFSNMTEDLGAQRLCIKCARDGHLLFCKNELCLLAVHKDCLGLSFQFIDEGLFYCPFCFHKKVVSTNDKKEKIEVSMAWKALSSFLNYSKYDCSELT